MGSSTQSSVVDDVDDEEDRDGGQFVPFTPLFERPSRERNRLKTIEAHAKRRRVAKRAVNVVVALQHKQGGRARDQQEFERFRDRASRLITRSGMLSLHTDLARVLTPKARKGLTRAP